MRLVAPLAIALALVVAAPAASARTEDSLRLEFQKSSKVVGTVQAEGLTWALVVFAPGGAAATFELDGLSSVHEHTYAAFQRDEARPVLEEATTIVPAHNGLERDHPSHVKGEASFGDGYTSLIVQAERITLGMRAATYIETPDDGAEMAWFLPEAPVPVGTYRDTPDVRPDSVALGLTPDGTSMVFAAQGVRSLEWFGATTRCAGDCLPGGGKTVVLDGGLAQVETFTYVEMQAATGSLFVTGLPATVAAGAETFDLFASGYFHFTRVDLQGCQGAPCPETDGQSLRVNGSLELRGLHQSSSDRDRVATTASGEAFSASLDGTPFAFLSQARGAATAAAAAAIGAYAVWKLLAVFLARHYGEALDHGPTKEVYDLIVQRPGSMFTEIKAGLRRGNDNLARQLRRLQKAGKIVAHRYRDTLLYFQNHGRYDLSWRQHAALLDERSRLVHAWLLACPGSTQTQVRQGALPGVPRQTVQKALYRLKEAGLLREERDGRRVHYRAFKIPEPPASGPATVSSV